jgi:two-component system chemotaxis response regulator CheB
MGLLTHKAPFHLVIRCDNFPLGFKPYSPYLSKHLSSLFSLMQKHDIIVIGASAGGIEALKKMTRELPRSISAAIFIVVHISNESKNLLPEILNRESPLECLLAQDNKSFRQGKIYVARNDCHLEIRNARTFVTMEPRENGFRPSIDTLFRSAAYAYGPRVIGVILTGLLDDGSAGILAVKKMGGISIIQDPKDALFSEMPQNALNYIKTDHCAPLSKIPSLLIQLSGLKNRQKSKSIISKEVRKAFRLNNSRDQKKKTNEIFTCPFCHGPLAEEHERKLIRYRCKVGHILSPESLVATQSEDLDRTLWASMRALEERRLLIEKLAQKMPKTFDRNYKERSEQIGRHIKLLKQIIKAKTSA